VEVEIDSLWCFLGLALSASRFYHMLFHFGAHPKAEPAMQWASVSQTDCGTEIEPEKVLAEEIVVIYAGRGEPWPRIRSALAMVFRRMVDVSRPKWVFADTSRASTKKLSQSSA
jgi:hypothetical protein